MSNGVKIVIAGGIYPPDIGGPATYSQLIAREFVKRKINVAVICYSDKKEGPLDKKEKFRILRISRNHNILIRYWFYFWNLFKIAKNSDVIYAQGPLSAGLPAVLVTKILRKKSVIKIVGDYAWEQGVNQFGVKDLIEPFQNKKYNWKVELIRKIQKSVVKNADKIIVPSEFLKRIVTSWGSDRDKVEVIYNAGPEVKEIEGKLDLEGDVIISAGRLEPWKGMSVLVEIMPELLKENSNFRLIIIGRGPEWKNIKSQITRLKRKFANGQANLKSEKVVQLIDKLPHDELMEYLKASKIFVLNTAYEGLSHILLEAMACGLPVITTNVCGNPEVVKDSYDGLLVEYNNKKQLKEAILRLWKDNNLRIKFVENGYKTLENFRLEKMIKETIKVLGN